MHYFSKQFLDGLQTKSENFQNKFFEIIDDICGYLDAEEEKREFQQYIEANHIYDKPGNTLYSSQVYMGGKEEIEKLKERVHFHLLSLFDSFEAADVMVEVPHIIVCLSTSNPNFTDKDMDFLKSIINFERACRGVVPAAVTTILNIRDDATSCYVAGLK